MLLKPFSTALIMTIFSCTGSQSQEAAEPVSLQTTKSPSAIYHNIGTIPTPAGYHRADLPANSFGFWLRQLPLREDKTVYLYNGQEKRNQSAQFAVLDISIGEKDLQQCADAAMRLRAEYLFSQREFEKIRFVDNEGGVYQFDQPYSRQNFQSYLNRVFGMCGTASLSKQMKSITSAEIKAGDLLLKGGFPGHAVMIVDVAENAAGEKIYLLAQSYMPAQNIHVLINPSNEKLSPWYIFENQQVIETPEWTFHNNQFMTW